MAGAGKMPCCPKSPSVSDGAVVLWPRRWGSQFLLPVADRLCPVGRWFAESSPAVAPVVTCTCFTPKSREYCICFCPCFSPAALSICLCPGRGGWIFLLLLFQKQVSASVLVAIALVDWSQEASGALSVSLWSHQSPPCLHPGGFLWSPAHLSLLVNTGEGQGRRAFRWVGSPFVPESPSQDWLHDVWSAQSHTVPPLAGPRAGFSALVSPSWAL